MTEAEELRALRLRVAELKQSNCILVVCIVATQLIMFLHALVVN